MNTIHACMRTHHWIHFKNSGILRFQGGARQAANMEMIMKVLVFGATGGSGRAAVQQLLADGHVVSAFARREATHGEQRAVHYVYGDVMNAADVERAVKGQDAVVVTLGISENPLRVRLFGPARTPISVRSSGTQHIIAAMREHGVRKLVVQTTYGVGATRHRLTFADRLFFDLILRPQIVDTERQNSDVAGSGLDWVLVQPVHLTDGAEDAMPFISTQGEIGELKVTRNSVGRLLAQAVVDPALVGKSVAVSGQRAVA
jgi:putative NADH-flavin reductase